MMKKIHNSQQGFTLVELLITMALAGLIMAAVYSGYRTTSRVQVNQLGIVDMQQNVRAAMNFIENDLRMAGYDPTGVAGATICTATAGQVIVSQDLNDSGDIVPVAGVGCPGTGAGAAQNNEIIALGFNAADDGDGDGVADDGFAPFGRNINGGGFSSIAEGISAVEFNYILDNDTETLTPSAAQRDRIVKIQVSMLARSERSDSEYTDNRRYTTASGKIWGPFPDNFRRRMFITTIKCRNMGS